jgi:hypothetical protein
MYSNSLILAMTMICSIVMKSFISVCLVSRGQELHAQIIYRIWPLLPEKSSVQLKMFFQATHACNMRDVCSAQAISWCWNRPFLARAMFSNLLLASATIAIIIISSSRRIGAEDMRTL